MSDTTQDRPRRRRRFGIWMLLSLAALAGVVGLALLAFTGRMIELPGWAVARIEDRVNDALSPFQVDLGRLDVFFSDSGAPRVHLSEVVLEDPAGRALALLPEASVTLVPEALLRGELALERVALTGTELTLRRAPDGAFDLALGSSAVPVSHATSLGDVIDGVDEVLAHPILTTLKGITAEELALTYEDARAGRVWTVEDGLLTMDQTDQAVSARLFFSLRNDRGVPSEVALSFTTQKATPQTVVSANFSDVLSTDIATQSPALAFLTVVDAPISGALRSGITETGELAPLNAALEIGAGALRPLEGSVPIRFDSSKTYFSYAPQTGKVTLDEFALDTDVLRIRAEGQSLLKDDVEGWPTTLINQFRFREVEFDPQGMFEEPARFSSGVLDLKATLDPFEVTIGQVVLTDDQQVNYRGRGKIRAFPEGWKVDVDLSLDKISNTRLLALWPISVVTKTRQWIAENVLEGTFTNVQAALRLSPGTEPRVTLSHEFHDSTVRFLKTMPPIVEGSGYATILDKSFTLVAERGHVEAPAGGQIDVAGSVMRVADVTVKPAQAAITLRTDSAIPDILSVLDLPPLDIMTKSGQPVDLASGRAVTLTQLDLPLKKKLAPQEVRYSVKGSLLGVASDQLVKGRMLTADRLELLANNDELTIGGPGALDGVPLRGTWSQSMDAENKGNSTVEGTIELSQRAVDAFSIGLPKGSVSGAGVGNIRIQMQRDQAPRFELTSDLNRMGLRLADIGWSKSKTTKGSLRVAGALGTVPVIDRLEVSAPGLKATGTVSIKPDGTLNKASFSRVQLGSWLDAPVVLSGRGAGASPAVAVTGGTADLRRLNSGSGGSGTGGSSSGGAVDLALDQLVVSDGIRLSDVRGTLTNGARKGTLTGTIGGAQIRADLTPSGNAAAIRVTSKDAGRVLRGAGIFQSARGGTLDLRLTPNGPSGHYKGKVTMQSIRVKDAPVLAELLNAVSVVGLLDKLGGSGLAFSEVSGNFLLTPEALQISKGAAVGPSMGISLAGLYTFGTNKLKMQGVISPIYMVNAVGSVLTRRGEGLFGFNYRLRGTADDPKVNVNPLSILTPGMFREIFRSAPPEITQ